MFEIRMMDSKTEPVILNGNNYAIWGPNMEALLKREGLRQYTKVIIPNLIDDQVKFVIDEK